MDVEKVLVGAVAGILRPVLTVVFTELFAKMQARDPQGHAATLKSLYLGLGQLERFTSKTPTKIDDAAEGGIYDAVVNSSEQFDIELPALGS